MCLSSEVLVSHIERFLLWFNNMSQLENSQNQQQTHWNTNNYWSFSSSLPFIVLFTAVHCRAQCLSSVKTVRECQTWLCALSFCAVTLDDCAGSSGERGCQLTSRSLSSILTHSANESFAPSGKVHGSLLCSTCYWNAAALPLNWERPMQLM